MPAPKMEKQKSKKVASKLLGKPQAALAEGRRPWCVGRGRRLLKRGIVVQRAVQRTKGRLRKRERLRKSLGEADSMRNLSGDVNLLGDVNWLKSSDQQGGGESVAG